MKIGSSQVAGGAKTYFEWDAEKAEENQRKHGISFEDAAISLLGLAFTRTSPRGEENRLMSFCECRGRIITVIWMPRLNVIRIVSARSARRNEKAHYYASVRRSAQAGGH